MGVEGVAEEIQLDHYAACGALRIDQRTAIITFQKHAPGSERCVGGGGYLCLTTAALDDVVAAMNRQLRFFFFFRREKNKRAGSLICVPDVVRAANYRRTTNSTLTLGRLGPKIYDNGARRCGNCGTTRCVEMTRAIHSNTVGERRSDL